MSKSYTEDIIKAAYEVWDVMHREAKKRGLALVKQKPHGDGRVLMGTISAFINGLNTERDWGLDKNQIDLIRRYLKQSGNVVSLEKVADYQFRIFVREEWSNASVVTAPVPKKTSKSRDPEGKKLTPEEAGETRDPAPVEYKCAEPDCGKTFTGKNADMALMGHRASHSPRAHKRNHTAGFRSGLTERMENLLVALYNAGGEIVDEGGGAASVWAKLANESRMYVSGSQLRLQKRKLLKREGKSKITYRYSLTPKGEKLAAKLAKSRPHQEAVKHHVMNYDPEKVKGLAESSGVSKDIVTGNERVDMALLHLATAIAGELFLAKTSDHEEKLSLVSDIIKEVNEGKLTPLKALGDIEAALGL